MIVPDATLQRIADATARAQGGDPEGACADLEALWEQLGPGGDPLHRCAAAHALAELQDEADDELRWDLRALDAYGLITDERATEAGVAGPVYGFEPSLHLSIADAYRRLGEPWDARDHLELGWAAVESLGDDPYGRMIRAGLDRLRSQLDAEEGRG
ncbi:MAG: hypothetical protein JHD16_06855 [Solirubrobacteraceae bacterium]|nr:hypothetical protein [Solirubrobacteraceae bacterium]